MRNEKRGFLKLKKEKNPFFKHRDGEMRIEEKFNNDLDDEVNECNPA